MPWLPELFSAPVVARYEDEHAGARDIVPYYAGLLTGETDALAGSFSGEPEVHDPTRGRIKGAGPFAAYVRDMNEWFGERNVSIEAVDRVLTRGVSIEEYLLHFGGETGDTEVPVAIVADKTGGRIDELRVYHTTLGLTGRHVNRQPLLQADPEVTESDVVGEYQRALAAGDVDAIVATFEPDGYAREPAGGRYVHRGTSGLREFYEHLFSNGGGIPLEHCRVIDDGRACALEYNVRRWGKTELPPQAGVAVYVRGETGKLAAARIYDDADPPLGAAS
jgi:hypothetical protein